MTSITSKVQAGTSRKCGLPISGSGKTVYATGKGDVLSSSSGKTSNSSLFSISFINKNSKSVDNTKNYGPCNNLANAKSKSSSTSTEKTNVTFDTKEKTLNHTEKTSNLNPMNVKYNSNGMVTTRSTLPSSLQNSSTKPISYSKVNEKEKSMFLNSKNIERDGKFGVKTVVSPKIATSSFRTNRIVTEGCNPVVDACKVQVSQKRLEYKENIHSSQNNDDIISAKDYTRKNTINDVDKINRNQIDISKVTKNNVVITDKTISNVANKIKDECNKSHLDANKIIGLDTRKNSSIGFEYLKKCSVTKLEEQSKASSSSCSKGTESFYKPQIQSNSPSLDNKNLVNPKANDSISNKVSIVINEKTIESDYSKIFSIKRSDVPIVIPAKPKQKSIVPISKSDKVGFIKSPVNLEDLKVIDKKNNMKTFVTVRKLSLQDTKNVLPNQISEKDKNKRKGSESMNLISKEKSLYILDKKKNEISNGNKIDFTSMNKATETSKFNNKKSDSNERILDGNKGRFSTDIMNENYSPSYSAAITPKRKSKFVFGIIWLPLRKRNKHKNIVYHPHYNDYHERSPSMYPFMSGDSSNNQPYKKKEEETELLVVEKKVAAPSAGLVAAVEAPVPKTENNEPLAEEKQEFIRREKEDSRDGAGDTNERDRDDKKDDNEEFLEDKPKEVNKLNKNKLIDKVDSVYLRPPPPHKTRSNPSTIEEESCGMKCLYFTLQCCDCTLM